MKPGSCQFDTKVAHGTFRDMSSAVFILVLYSRDNSKNAHTDVCMTIKLTPDVDRGLVLSHISRSAGSDCLLRPFMPPKPQGWCRILDPWTVVENILSTFEREVKGGQARDDYNCTESCRALTVCGMDIGTLNSLQVLRFP